AEDDVLHQLVRGLEAERGRVADVELEDRVPLGLQLLCPGEDRTAQVVLDLVQLPGLLELHVTQLQGAGALAADRRLWRRQRLVRCVSPFVPGVPVRPHGSFAMRPEIWMVRA